MKLITERGKEFELRKTTCRDEIYFATRIAVKKSIKTGFISIRQYRKQIDTFYHRTISGLTVDLSQGQLRLGCHYFDKKSTKQILRWAGVK